MGRKLTTKTFIEKANIVQNNIYDYSLVDYKHSNIKIKIICHKHGVFEQTPTNHMTGHGCNSCALELKSVNQRKTSKNFIDKSNKVHNGLYDYSLVDYKNTHSDIKIVCKIHGEFNQRPCHHIRGSGCPLCNESKGEKEIREFLEDNIIDYSQQHKFNDCRNVLPLPFDFYLPSYNTCIEYDGIQHFKPKDFFGGENGLKKRKELDGIKTKYCEDNKIPLIRIRYNENVINKLKIKL